MLTLRQYQIGNNHFRRFSAMHFLISTAFAVFVLCTALSPAQAARHRHSPAAPRSSTATYFSRRDSNPHLANGDDYGRSGPWFCAVDRSRRNLLNHRIRVVNRRNGRSHIFLVADLGRFSRGNVDISRGGSARLSGRGGPDNFPVEWHDLGIAPQAEAHQRSESHRRYHHKKHSGNV